MEEMVQLAPRLVHKVLDELSITQSVIELLIRDASIAPDVCEKLALIKWQVRQVGAPAIQLLEITKTRDRHLQIVDVAEVLLDLTRLLECLLGKAIKLQIESDADLWPIRAATDQFDEIFCNLAVNSRQAMPNGGVLRIRGTNVKAAMGGTDPKDATSTGYVSIEIEDTGVGIPELDLGRIFDPFFTTKGAGCGFGLARVDIHRQKCKWSNYRDVRSWQRDNVSHSFAATSPTTIESRILIVGSSNSGPCDDRNLHSGGVV